MANKRENGLAGWLAVAAAAAGILQAQSSRTVLEGVYAAEQAARGRAAYELKCARCHGLNLDGGGTAPALHSSTFLDAWREDYLSSLFQYMQTRMPPPGKAAGILPEQDYVDIVAYVLSINQLPAGPRELTRANLDTTLLVGPDGPKPLPPSATVRVVGCLAHAGDAWSLTRSTVPGRVRDGSETSPGEVEQSSGAPLGTENFGLANLDDDRKESDLLPHVGEKVQVKGILNGQGASARIYVLSFEPLARKCDR